MNRILFLLFIFASSCSFFIAKIDTPLVDEENYHRNVPQKDTYCSLTQAASFQMIGTNEDSQRVYHLMVQQIGRKLDFLDHFALWSLLQLSIRPDQSSPTSRIQAIFHREGKSFYFDFFSEESEDQYPYLYGIQWILKKFKKTTSLEEYARLLESSMGEKLKIGKDLENFLVTNKDAIKLNPELARFYFRGTEILKENETTPRLSFTEVMRHYRKVEKKQNTIINTSLTPFVTEAGNQGSCNYDFNLYENSIFLIDRVIPVANLFGLSLNQSGFMASSSQKLPTLISLKGLPIFKGESKVRSSAVCVIENDKNKVWTFSNQSRDPGQHLFHLIRYGLPKSKSAFEVDKLLRHSRHLFLSEPVRLIIESTRSRQDQIENLLKLNLPIYNAEKLGNIWAYTFFNDQNRFIIDDRNPGAYLCK